MKKSKKEDKLSMCMITQALYRQHWDATKWDGDDIENADIGYITCHVAELLESVDGCEVDAVYGIVHDRDSREVWNEKLKDYVIEQKHLHAHLVVKFKDKESGLTISSIAETVGIAAQYIEKAKAGRYAFDNMLSYLIHAKDSNKYQYDVNSVVSVVKKDAQSYQEIYAERKAAWEKGRAKKTADNAKSVDIVEDLYEKVINGEVTKNQLLLTDDYYAVYSRNIDKFEKGLRAYTDRKIMQAVRELEAGSFSLNVLYFQGPAGHGKTKTAIELAKSLVDKAEKRGERWEICQAAATNPLDDYHGEEILIMDDLRGNAMRATDWLKLLDPFNSSPNSARYKNKRVVSRFIFITSVQDVYDFFYYTKNAGADRSEPLDQFMRRILALVKVVQVDNKRVIEVKPRVEYTYDKNIQNERKPHGFDTLTLHHGFYSRGIEFTSDNFHIFSEHLFDDDKRKDLLKIAQKKQNELLQLDDVSDEK